MPGSRSPTAHGNWFLAPLLASLFSGCLAADQEYYPVDVSTRYDFAAQYEGQQQFALANGTPAIGGMMSIDTIPAAWVGKPITLDPVSCDASNCDGQSWSPKTDHHDCGELRTPKPISSGDALRPFADYCYYTVALDDTGRASFLVPTSPALNVRLTLDGPTPSQVEGCRDRRYSNEGHVEQNPGFDVTGPVTIQIRYYVTCFMG